MINVIVEGEVMVTHSLCPTKLVGTKAMCSVHGSVAGSDTEHVDETMSPCVTDGC